MTPADPSSGELKRQLAVMPNRQQLHQVARSGHRVQEQVVAVQVFAKPIRSVRRRRRVWGQVLPVAINCVSIPPSPLTTAFGHLSERI